MRAVTFKIWYFHYALNEELEYNITITYPATYKGDYLKKAWHDVIYKALAYLHDNGGLDVMELCRVDLISG